MFKTGAVLSQDQGLQLSREEFGPGLVKEEKKHLCRERFELFPFSIFVINDLSKCEEASECFSCAGASKKPSNYLSRISYSTIRGQVAIGFHDFFCAEMVSTEWFHWDAL